MAISISVMVFFFLLPIARLKLDRSFKIHHVVIMYIIIIDEHVRLPDKDCNNTSFLSITAGYTYHTVLGDIATLYPLFPAGGSDWLVNTLRKVLR